MVFTQMSYELNKAAENALPKDRELRLKARFASFILCSGNEKLKNVPLAFVSNYVY